MGNLDELRQLREPCGNRDGGARELARPAASVPLLVSGPERLEHRLGQTELLGERPRQRGVLDDHPVDLPVAREDELEHVEPHPLREPERDQALAQDVLHRLSEAEVDAEGE
jgi:hypothetical protein